jgi:hypothetical protein
LIQKRVLVSYRVISPDFSAVCCQVQDAHVIDELLGKDIPFLSENAKLQVLSGSARLLPSTDIQDDMRLPHRARYRSFDPWVGVAVLR